MEDRNGSMKILGLKVDGLRKLKAVNLTFNENGLLVIKGENEQGKTTLWDSIKWLVQGNKHLNQDIISHGKDKAVGELRVGDYIIKRTATKKTNTLEVKNIKTNQFEKGEVQNFLNTFVNVLTFNPRPFAQKTSLEKYQFCLELFKDQLEKLSKEVLGYGFTGIDAKLATLEEERKLKGREVKAFGDLDIDVPEKLLRVDLSEILTKKKAVEDSNKKLTDDYDTAKQKEIDEIDSFNKIQREINSSLKTENDKADNLRVTITGINIEIEDLRKKLAEKELESKKNNEQLQLTLELISKLPQPLPEKPLTPTITKPELQPTESFDIQIQELGAINEKAELYEKHLAKVNDKAAKQAEYEDFDEKIKDLRLQKLEILRKVNTGVDGLEIREDGIYHKDIFCENWSDAQGLKISCELAYSNLPPMRAIFIDQGEGLDKNARKELENFAKEKDLLIGVSIVADELTEEDKNSDNVFWIEDGTIQEKKL